MPPAKADYNSDVMQELPFVWRVETLREKHDLILADIPDGTLLTFNNERKLVVFGDDAHVVALSVQERTKLKLIIDLVNQLSPPFTNG